MTKVAIVAGPDLVRVTPQSEHAVPKSFSTWTEAVAYCKEQKYEIHNQAEADEWCAKELAALEALLKADLDDDESKHRG